MSSKETEAAVKARLDMLMANVERYISQPWVLMHEPYQITDNVYYLGNAWVSSFLVKTSEGLVMIDSTFKEVAYQLFDGIRALGFDPHDVKFLLLSHGHFDHVGAARLIQEYSHCKTYIGQGDAFFFTDRKDLIIKEDHVPEFTIDEYYDYEKPMIVGNTSFSFFHTPGHTPGCTSIMFNSTVNGKPVTVAMHGGLGINGLTYGELDAARLPRQLQEDYYQSLLYIREKHVDVVLASHMNMYNMDARRAADKDNLEVFIDPAGWKNMINAKLEAFIEIYGQ